MLPPEVSEHGLERPVVAEVAGAEQAEHPHAHRSSVRGRHVCLLPSGDQRVDGDGEPARVERGAVLDPFTGARPDPAGHPCGQMAVARAPVVRGQRSPPDRRDEAPDVLGEQPGRRVQRARPARVQVDAAGALGRVRPLGAGGVVAPEVQQLRHLVERPVQGDLGDVRAVRVVVAVHRFHPAQHVGPHHPVEVVATGLEQQTAEALRRVRRVGGEPVLVGDRHLAVAVDDRLAGVREDHLRPLVQRLHAAPQQVPAVQVVVRCPLEQLAAGLVEDVVVVRRGADVAGQPQVPDARVLRGVPAADVLGPVARGVVGDDQLEVLVGLAEQGVERLGQVLLAVVHGQADAQPGSVGHVVLTSGMGSRWRSRRADRRCSHHRAEPLMVAAATPQADPTVPAATAPPSPPPT